MAAISVAIAASSAMGGSLPAIKTAAGNTVPACVTAERLMAFLKARNGDLELRFGAVAATYKRLGDELGVRWDIAFFQMMVETGHLTFRRHGRIGDVQPAQNNFAGMGATGNGEPGEKFASIDAGIKAHLQHVLMYAGDRIDAPVADRTRKVQEWGVLTAWQKGFKRAISFTDLTQKWSPNDQSYASTIEAIADTFRAEHCAAPADMKAEAVGPMPAVIAARQPQTAGVHPNRQGGVSVIEATTVKSLPAAGSGADLARQAMERARAEGDGSRAALGAKTIGRSTAAAPKPPENDMAAIKTVTTVSVAAGAGVARVTDKLGDKIAGSAPSAAAKTQCRVFTASYGGVKSVIIKQMDGLYANYTVLDVNDADEEREVKAYIGAYARNGQKVGDFRNQPEALDEAFKLCPEG